MSEKCNAVSGGEFRVSGVLTFISSKDQEPLASRYSFFTVGENYTADMPGLIRAFCNATSNPTK